MSVLVAYGTIEGHTGKIARFVEQVVREKGDEVTMFDTASNTANVELADFTKIILAASVHERRHPVEFEVFLSANKEALSDKRTLLLSVSLSAAFEDGLEEAQDYVDEMKLRTGFDPGLESVVAGAVRPASYDYYEAQVLRFAVLKDREYELSAKEHEFTDWKAVKDVVATFLDGTSGS